jgi:hypothetical protein
MKVFITGATECIGKPLDHMPGSSMHSKTCLWSWQEGFVFDGSKAERELGLTYTSLRVALEEAIASSTHNSDD